MRPIITGPHGQANAAEIIKRKVSDMKRGQLFNISGNRVGRYNQALNIGRREARLAGARDVPVEGKAREDEAIRARQALRRAQARCLPASQESRLTPKRDQVLTPVFCCCVLAGDLHWKRESDLVSMEQTND